MLPDSSVHCKAEDLLYFTVQCALTERYIQIQYQSFYNYKEGQEN